MKEKVTQLLNEFLDTRNDLFLLEYSISPENQIKIIIDGDKSVNIQDCLDVSRAIEFNLDREIEDFSLDVGSAGIDAPLQLPRQYIKNIGREIKAHTIDNQTLIGIITEADNESVAIEWKTRENKAVGKGKTTVTQKQNIPYNQITKATINIKF